MWLTTSPTGCSTTDRSRDGSLSQAGGCEEGRAGPGFCVVPGFTPENGDGQLRPADWQHFPLIGHSTQPSKRFVAIYKPLIHDPLSKSVYGPARRKAP